MNATDNLFVSESQADEFELLMESARPDLYRANAFRVSGLAIEATAREIARLGEKLKVLEKTGGTLPSGAAGGAGGACGALPLAPPPEPAMVHAAIERLRDPEQRLVDEFFWFWPQQPGESRDDEALQSLARGEVAEAEKLWQAQSDSASGGVARHNLAVLNHLMALDLEAQPLNEEQRQRLNDSWRNAGRLWATLIVHDGSVWARLTERALELDDPRITAQTVARLRASLPLALVMINGQLAISAAERGQPEDAARHQRLIADSGFTPSTQHDALRRVVEPLRARQKSVQGRRDGN